MNGTANDSAVSSTGSFSRARMNAAANPTTSPTTAPPMAARKKSAPTCQRLTDPASAAMAVRRATSAAASLKRLSPSSGRISLRVLPTRRATTLAATASGGATTAPSAMPPASGSPGITAQATTPTPSAVNTTSPTDISPIALRFFRKSTSDVWMAAEYSSGGSRPSSTTSGSRWTSGTPGT